MSQTIAQIRTSMATVINAALTNVEAEARAAGNYAPGATVIIFPSPGGRQTASCQKWEHQFVLEIHVPTGPPLPDVQNTLDAIIDPFAATGLTAALEADKTLGGTVDYLAVGAFSDYGYAKLNDAPTLSALMPVSVGI